LEQLAVTRMHQYVTDSEEKKLIFLILALLSILAAWLLYEMAITISSFTGWWVPWWLEIPSIMTFYGLFYEFFDRWLWKKPIFRKLGLVSTPNLNGKWKGNVKTSHDEFKEEIEASLEIFQTWTQVAIFQDTKTSKGSSFVATIQTKDPFGIRLFFMYRNIPEIDADPNLHQHTGSAQLVLTPNEKTLSGDYYNCMRDRPTYGKLHFERS
jgi:hypothetical protein